MNRRDALRSVFATVCASSAAWSPLTRAQKRIPRVAMVLGSTEATQTQNVKLFLEGMKELGYVDGNNFVLELRFGQASRERTQTMVAEAIASKPDVLVGGGSGGYFMAKSTKTMPVIAIFSGDMVEAGMVKSLAQPGGNVSGVQLMMLDLVGKRIEVLKECVPGIKRLAVIGSPTHSGVQGERNTSILAAKQLGISAIFYPVGEQTELDAALLTAKSNGADSLVVFPDGVTSGGAERIAAFAIKHKMPMASGWDRFAEVGGLVTYGPSLRATWRRGASYVVKVLNGVNPGTIPVELPTIFELVVNLKTARALKLEIPQSVMVRADRVIA